MISDYERGKREPAFGAVDIILGAAGIELELVPTSTLTHVRRHREEILRLLGEGGATAIGIFGSVAHGDESVGSDIDLLIDVADSTGLFDLLRMQDALEKLLHRRVDLVPQAGLKPDVAAEIARDTVPL